MLRIYTGGVWEGVNVDTHLLCLSVVFLLIRFLELLSQLVCCTTRIIIHFGYCLGG